MKKWAGLWLWGMIFSFLPMAAQAQSGSNPLASSPQSGLESPDPLGTCSFPKEATIYEKRLQEYQKALQDNPSDAELHYHLGILQARLQQWEPAQASFFQALANEPESAAKVYHQLGNLYACQRKFDHAIAQYKQTLRSNPDHEDTQHNLALTQLLARQEKQNRQVNPRPESGENSNQSEPQSSENPTQNPSDEENSSKENLAEQGANLQEPPPSSEQNPPSEQTPSAEPAHSQKKDASPLAEKNPNARQTELSRQEAAQQVDAIPENRRKFIQRLIQRQNLPADVLGNDW